MVQLLGFVVALIVGLSLAMSPTPRLTANHSPDKNPNTVPQAVSTPVGVSGGGPVGHIPVPPQISPAGPGK